MSGNSLFPGGIHPKEGSNGKRLTATLPVEKIDAPARVVIPLSQHIGKPARCVVKKGEHVKIGQLIGEADGLISASVHSSVSGKVVSIGQCLLPNGLLSEAVIIDNDFEDKWIDLNPPENPEKLSREELCRYIREAGIVGMGGAAFPTAVKLSPPEGTKIKALIVNGVECEPYLSADHRLMLENTKDIIDGIELALIALGIEKAIIGVENNKTDAAEALRRAVETNHIVVEKSHRRTIRELPVRYPQGSEKQLIYALTRKRVPNGALPASIGYVVCNVGTMAAVSRALRQGKPLIERIVTVAGMFEKPGNYRVRIGTPLEVLMEAAGGIKKEARQLIYGGPMMGTAISRSDIPVMKGCSGLVALETICMERHESQCIRCGRCVRVCPMQLMPTLLDQYMRVNDFEAAKRIGAVNCIECGSCAYACPAKRSLVQSIRVAKRAISDMAAKEKARVEKEKQELEQKGE